MLKMQQCTLYSLVRLVRPNKEELISWPFLGLIKIAAPGPYETLKPPKLLFAREQIHVNQRDKYDHPHQREPWCLTEVENKVGAAAMPTNFGGSGVLYGPGATIGSLIDP